MNVALVFRYSWTRGERGLVAGVQIGRWTIGVAWWVGSRGGLCVGAWS